MKKPQKSFNRVLVLGMGKVGSLVAQLLELSGFSVTAMDKNPDKTYGIKVIKGDCSNARQLTAAYKKTDAVISCLPYFMNIRAATLAHKAGIHYFDLTEDVQTTEVIREMAKNSKGVMVPQCGLAPGFIGIVGADLATKVEKIRSLELRVGALPQHPKGLLGYAFNWSAEGVVNEYLNDCEVIRGGEIKFVPAMQDIETIVIGGDKLEAFTTSGGLGTMCETYKGKIEDLNYKTMRYPGHCHLMRFFFHELLMKEDKERAGKILVNAKPPVREDVVYVHAAVEGLKTGRLKRFEFVRAYYPKPVNGEAWRAISWTTAASAVAVIELVAQGKLPQKGFIKQEHIKLQDFFATKAARFYKEEERNER